MIFDAYYHQNFIVFWMRIWIQFASQDGPQIDAKIDRKINHFLITFWLCFHAKNMLKYAKLMLNIC